MADGAVDQPIPKKIKLDNSAGASVDNSVFSDFKKDENKLLDLKHAVLALNEGFNGMNFFLTKFIDLNARSPVSFSSATCNIAEPQPTGKYVAASIFQIGIAILEQYLNTDQLIVPANERQQNALRKLLIFLTEDHDELVELQKESSGIQEGEWAYSVLQHLLIKLAVDNKFVMASYPSLPLPPDMSSGCIGDTSFGCEKGWHGSVDILLENTLPVQLFTSTQLDDQTERSVSSIEIESDNLFSDNGEAQLIAQTIVFSFLQHKYNKSDLKNFLVPAIGISTSRVYVNLYDCENDIFLSSEKNLKLLGKKLYDEIVVLLWLTLNYRDFCTGITEEMKSCKADFHKRVDDDLLSEYRDNVKRPLHLSTKKRDTSEDLGYVRGRKVKRSYEEIKFVTLQQ